MPKINFQQTNFTAGEISPKVVGRVDIDRYANSAKEMVNCHPTLHGGAIRRDGTRFVKATKTAANLARLLPFIYSRDQAYMLEFGDLYVRFFAPGGAFLAEVVGPYTQAQLADIDYVQGADTMFLFHPNVPTQRLRRVSDALWDLSAAPFLVQPFDEVGHYLAANVTLSASTVGAGRTATADAAVFLLSDVGRNLISATGIAQITGFSSTTVVIVTITVAFISTALASQAWYLDLSPQGFVVPSGKDNAGSFSTLTGALTRPATLTLTAKTGAVTINASAGVFVAGDTGKTLYADSGVVVLAFVSATQCTGTTSVDFLSLNYAPGAWGITDNVFRAEDVGKFIRMNGGLAKITTFTSATSVVAQVLLAFTSAIACAPLAWTLEQSVWSAAFGYPRTGTLHEQRLWAAGSAKYPQTIWGSQTGIYLDFTKGTADNNACIFTMASDEINPISYLAAARNLLVHTYGGEFTMQGGIEKPITPSNAQVKPQTPHGSKGVRPVTIGNESIYVQRSGLKIRGMSFDASRDRYVSPDLTVLAEHITKSGIVSMSWQQEPAQLLWVVLADGSLISCTLDRDQNVNGWAKHYTDGAVESVATIPVGNYEQTWLIVRRTINGATVRYVEYLDHTFQPMLAAPATTYPPQKQAPVYKTTVDCGIVIDNVVGQTTFTGLSHLEGKSVQVLADGSPMGAFTVTGGAITLPRLSYRTLIGLSFRSYVTLLSPEVGGPTGSAQATYMRCSEVALRFNATLGATVTDGNGNPQTVPFRYFGAGVLDKPPALYTGLVYIETLGWERGRCEFTISQDQPLPMELLSVIRQFTTNGG